MATKPIWYAYCVSDETGDSLGAYGAISQRDHALVDEVLNATAQPITVVFGEVRGDNLNEALNAIRLGDWESGGPDKK
jgi:NADPH:quinone reductase-like Zn-dependent oxidoreductase